MLPPLRVLADHRRDRPLGQAASLDHVGADKKCAWDGEAESLRGLQIDDKLVLRRLDHRQIRGLNALENAPYVGARLAPEVRSVGAVTHQAPTADQLRRIINHRNAVLRCQRQNHIRLNVDSRKCTDDERPGPAFNKGREGRLKVAFAVNLQDNDLAPERTRRLKYVTLLVRERWISCVFSKVGDRRRLRNQLTQQLEALGRELLGKEGHSCDVAAWP